MFRKRRLCSHDSIKPAPNLTLAKGFRLSECAKTSGHGRRIQRNDSPAFSCLAVASAKADVVAAVYDRRNLSKFQSLWLLLP